MIRILVTTTIVSQRDPQRLVHFAMEVDASSLEEVHQSLVRDGSIFGRRIITHKADENPRRIKELIPQVVGAGALGTATLCPYDFTEGSDDE